MLLARGHGAVCAAAALRLIRWCWYAAAGVGALWTTRGLPLRVVRSVRTAFRLDGLQHDRLRVLGSQRPQTCDPTCPAWAGEAVDR